MSTWSSDYSFDQIAFIIPALLKADGNATPWEMTVPFDYDDPYESIEAKICSVTKKAVQIEDDAGRKLWVPRSILDAGTDRVDVETMVGRVRWS